MAKAPGFRRLAKMEEARLKPAPTRSVVAHRLKPVASAARLKPIGRGARQVCEILDEADPARRASGSRKSRKEPDILRTVSLAQT